MLTNLLQRVLSSRFLKFGQEGEGFDTIRYATVPDEFINTTHGIQLEVLHYISLYALLMFRCRIRGAYRKRIY